MRDAIDTDIADIDPIRQFALGLQELRARANYPSFRDLEKRTGFSRTALNDAVRGRKVPTYDTARALIEGYGAQWRDWCPCWRAAVDQAGRRRAGRLAANRSRISGAPGAGS